MKPTFSSHNLRSIILIAAATVLLGRCSLIQKTPPQDQPMTFNDQVNQLVSVLNNMSQTHNYHATISQTYASGSATIYEFYSQDETTQKSIKTVNGQPFETYYQDNQSIIKHPRGDQWISLAIPKTDPAKNFGSPNYKNWLELTQTATEGSLTAQACATPDCYLISLQGQNNTQYQFSVIPSQNWLQSYQQISTDQTVNVIFAAGPITVEVPSSITPYTIPDSPTPEDVELIQAIYNS